MRPRSGKERSFRAVPSWLLFAFGVTLVLQVALRGTAPAPHAAAQDLPDPPSLNALEILALGEPVGLAYALGLRLQTFDNQPGVSIPFARLDYPKVEKWLDAMLALDPRGQYAMMMATYLYAQVFTRPDKQREMSAFVYRHFVEAPDQRWQWLAHMTIMAKHRLHDLPLAIRYADAIHALATGPEVPAWARQMRIFLREDVGEVESARALLGGLLASGTVKDPREFRFLSERLKSMGSAENSTGVTKR
ncbi:MAG: hypothetical protein GC151_06685 [Betaproteobacteria bacterium]|nr:hypothetical protein [Betaproteobacteria bacterium]